MLTPYTECSYVFRPLPSLENGCHLVIGHWSTLAVFRQTLMTFNQTSLSKAREMYEWMDWSPQQLLVQNHLCLCYSSIPTFVMAGSFFASSSLDGTIKIWSVATLTVAMHLNQEKDYLVDHSYPYSVHHFLSIDQVSSSLIHCIL